MQGLQAYRKDREHYFVAYIPCDQPENITLGIYYDKAEAQQAYEKLLPGEEALLILEQLRIEIQQDLDDPDYDPEPHDRKYYIEQGYYKRYQEDGYYSVTMIDTVPFFMGGIDIAGYRNSKQKE